MSQPEEAHDETWVTYSLTMAMVAMTFCSQIGWATAAPAQAATVIDIVSVQKQHFKEWCQGNPKLFQMAIVKAALQRHPQPSREMSMVMADYTDVSGLTDRQLWS